MVSRKYTKDYRVEYEPRSGGGLKAKPVYIGDYYSFDASEKELLKAKLICAITSILALAASIAGFCLNTFAGRELYVSLPHAVSIFPLSFLLIGVFNLFWQKQPYTREQRDKTSTRIINSSIMLMVFSTIAFGSNIYCRFAHADELSDPADFAYMLLLLSVSIFAGIAVTQKNKLIMKVDYSAKKADN